MIGTVDFVTQNGPQFGLEKSDAIISISISYLQIYKSKQQDLFPFLIAGGAVTQQLCPHTANLFCYYALVRFTLLSHRASGLGILMAGV